MWVRQPSQQKQKRLATFYLIECRNPNAISTSPLQTRPVTSPTDSGTLYTVIYMTYFKAHKGATNYTLLFQSIDDETRDPRGQSWHPLCSSCSRIRACWLIVLFISFNVCVGGGLRMTLGSCFSPAPRDQTQIIWVGGKHHPVLSNLTSPITLFVFNKA